MKVYENIKKRLMKPNSQRLRKKEIPQLEQEFLRIYEQIAKKEEEIGLEKSSKRFFYHTYVSNRIHTEVFRRLRKY